MPPHLVLVLQTQAWMSKHRREVARRIKDEKQQQLEPVQRRSTVRQRAAEQEIVKVVCAVLM